MSEIHLPPLSVLVIDDEPLARRRLKRILATIPGVEVIGEAGNVEQARSLIAGLLPDVILLDIQMPGGTGFDILVPPDGKAPAVVFVTAFDHYTLRAFEAAAIDYITKPVEPGRLQTAIERARLAITAQSSAERIMELNETVLALRQALRTKKALALDLWVKSRGDLIRIALDRVLRFEAERDYVRIHTDGPSYLHHESLTSLERRLNPTDFLRLHRGSIVRQAGIVGIRQGPFSALVVLLSDGSEIRVGRTYAHRIRSIIGDRRPQE